MSKYQLFYDDNCPLCRKAVKLIKKYISPKELLYLALSDSLISEYDQERALKEMLLLCPSGKKIWGYNTYIKLLRLSNNRFSIILNIFSYILTMPIIRSIGDFIYMKIASNRVRCSNDCYLQQ
tara:strand:- start:66 stop:434 length:369 start_codon:yes stop_codon:yes gene_type:complete